MYSFLPSSRRCLPLFQSFPLRSRFYVPAASSLHSPSKHHSQQFRSSSTKKDTREIIFKKDLAEHLAKKHGDTVIKHETIITDLFDLIAKVSSFGLHGLHQRKSHESLFMFLSVESYRR